MSKQNSTIAVFNDHTSAERAIKELQNAGFDIKKLSLLGKDFHSDEHVVGYYNTGDRMKYWGKLGAFWKEPAASCRVRTRSKRRFTPSKKWQRQGLETQSLGALVQKAPL